MGKGKRETHRISTQWLKTQHIENIPIRPLLVPPFPHLTRTQIMGRIHVARLPSPVYLFGKILPMCRACELGWEVEFTGTGTGCCGTGLAGSFEEIKDPAVGGGNLAA